MSFRRNDPATSHPHEMAHHLGNATQLTVRAVPQRVERSTLPSIRPNNLRPSEGSAFVESHRRLVVSTRLNFFFFFIIFPRFDRHSFLRSNNNNNSFAFFFSWPRYIYLYIYKERRKKPNSFCSSSAATAARRPRGSSLTLRINQDYGRTTRATRMYRTGPEST